MINLSDYDSGSYKFPNDFFVPKNQKLDRSVYLRPFLEAPLCL